MPPTPVARLAGHLRVPSRPLANPGNVLTGDHWRVSILDAGVVRLEWSPSGRFADLASSTVLHRDGPEVPKTVREDAAGLEIITERLHLSYDRSPFSEQGLAVQARGAVSSFHSTWRYGQVASGNLGGTARTLDGADGRIPLEDGILSRDGIAVHDDSATVLLDGDGWFASREPGSIDLYIFCFGRDYRAALAALYRLTGSPPIIPRFALGNWWSRYHPYTAGEYLALMDRFAAEGIPLAVAVIDMDWHLTDIDPALGSGWTGYTWNRDLFPDPPAFLRALRERKLRVTLNVHPADGVRAHEDGYAATARALGQDPADRLPVMFDATSPAFLTAYLEQVHHPREAEGVDFWWLDWQQGTSSRLRGLDPLWLLNHLHYLDSARDGSRLGRAMTFSRYAGLGSHRYPIGFSGDTVISWASLGFQPEFTATASNVGYGWWSHDVGGHMFGIKDDELAVRWLQLGCFSPIMRLHSTSDPFNSREPWRFGEVARRVMTRYLRLRHQLLPWLATMARRAHVDGRPLVEPMYYDHPFEEAAYAVPNQFTFGGSLVVAPVTTPRDPSTLLARTDVWLPEGEWVDVMTGLVYSGARTIAMHRDIERLPVMARPGTVVPIASPEGLGNGAEPSEELEVWIVAGASGEFVLQEDQDDDRWATTSLTYDDSIGVVSIGAVEGARESVPAYRTWRLVLLGCGTGFEVQVDGQALPARAGPVPNSTSVDLGRRDTAQSIVATVSGDRRLDAGDTRRRLFGLLDQGQIPYELKSATWVAATRGTPSAAALAVTRLDLPGNLTGAVLEIMLAR